MYSFSTVGTNCWRASLNKIWGMKRLFRHLSSALSHHVSSTDHLHAAYYDHFALQNSRNLLIAPLTLAASTWRRIEKSDKGWTKTNNGETSDNNIVRINLFAVPCLLPGGCCLEALIAGAAWDCGSCCSFPSVGMPASLNWLSRTVLRRKRW